MERPLEMTSKVWEDIATYDPLWGILTLPDKSQQQWDPDSFFQTGQQTIDAILHFSHSMSVPEQRQAALDFGCGVGRLTRSLSSQFEQCVGVDISPTMIELAQRYNQDLPNCEFRVNNAPLLSSFSDESFDMIVSMIVLQHLPSQALMKTYIAEFVRLLKPSGLLVFNLPSAKKWYTTLDTKLWRYQIGRCLGLSPHTLIQSLGCNPIRTHHLPEVDVVKCIKQGGGRVLLSIVMDRANGFENRWYYVSKPPRRSV